MTPARTVADHLVDRLADARPQRAELGVDRMFGVPGDYSLALLAGRISPDEQPYVDNALRAALEL